ncbi:MAG: hypothetical protein KF723_08985 [Rhizobiaceae bacterium]|nr:hypothetical protein [Rhizobiaceae bacterium]
MAGYVDRYQAWFDTSGTRYVRLGDVLWTSYSQMIVPFAPPSQAIDLDRAGEAELFARLPGRLIRWTGGFRGDASPWYSVVRRRVLDIDDYASKSVRNRLRRAFQGCDVRPLGGSDESGDIARVFREADARRGESSAVTDASMRRRMDMVAGFPDIVRHFGAYLDGRLIAVSVNYVFPGEGALMSEIKLAEDARKFNRSYGLIHTVSNALLADAPYVSDGYRSLLHETSIQAMLIDKLHFDYAFSTLNVAYRGPARTFVSLARPLRPVLARIDPRVGALLLQDEIARDSRGHLYELFEHDADIPAATAGEADIRVWKPTFGNLGFRGQFLRNVYWTLLSLGRFRIYYAADEGGKILHTSYLVPRIPRFPFMRFRDVQIGPSFTDEAARGKGMYAAALRRITRDVRQVGAMPKTARILAFVATGNHAVLRRIRRSGFRRIGLIAKKGLLKSYKPVVDLAETDGQ